jgi:hypothetical protein
MKDNDKDINKLSEEGTRTSSDKNKNKNDIENTLINLPENENNKLKSNNNNLPNQKLKKYFKPILVAEDNSIEFSKENYVIIKDNNFGSSKESELYKINDNKTKNENNKLDKINNNKIKIKINKKTKKKKYFYKRGNNLIYYYLNFKSNYNIIINSNNEYSNIYESINFKFFEIMVVNNKIKKFNFFKFKKSSKEKSDIKIILDNKTKNENNTKNNKNNKFDIVNNNEIIIIRNKRIKKKKDFYERSKNNTYYNSNYKENFDIIEVKFIKISGNLFQQEKSKEFEKNLLQNFSQSNNQNLIDQEMSNLEGNNIEFLNLY